MTPPLNELPRAERSRVVCRRVSRRIREATPDGLGGWDPALDLVREPSNRFLDVLDRWLDDANPDTRRRLIEVTADLTIAWKDAARRWEAAGRPGTGSDGRKGVPA